MAIRMSTKQARELGIIPKPPPSKGGMNSLEERYAGYLEQRKMCSDIVDYRFEPFKLILAHGVPGQRSEVTYKPDFLAILTPEVPKLIKEREVSHTLFRNCYEVEIHEVKGFWREDARLKIKMAAELFWWFKFYGVTWNRKERIWEFESF